MRITSQEIARYRQAESALCDAASEYVGLLMGDFHLQHPNASVAEARSAAIYAIDDALNAFGAQAGTLACDLFDDICEAEGLRVQSELEDTIDRSKVEDKVRWLAGRIEDIEAAGFDRSIRDLTSFYVKRQAYQNMVNNCERNGVRYARVPSGRETCSFCFMLSSRGFVYHSRKTAEGDGLHGVHQHCDCIIVPGIDGVTRIDGYDPDALYNRWSKCAKAIGADPSTGSEARRSAIMKEVERRDWRWLYGGDDAWRKHEQRFADTINDRLKNAKRAYLKDRSENGYQATYGKLFKDLSNELGVDIKGQYLTGRNLSPAMPDGDEVWAISQIGRPTLFLGTDSSRRGNPDVSYGDVMLDIKTPRSLNRVNKRLAEAAIQCREAGQDAGFAILSSLRYGDDFEAVVEKARSFVRNGDLDGVIVIQPGGFVEEIN